LKRWLRGRGTNAQLPAAGATADELQDRVIGHQRGGVALLHASAADLARRLASMT
jgi:hypothetical protein